MAEPSTTGHQTKPDAIREIIQLAPQVQQGDPNALARVRTVCDAHPGLWEQIGRALLEVEADWLAVLTGEDPLQTEAIRRELDRRRKALRGDTPTPLEALLVDQLVLCQLEVIHATRLNARLFGQHEHTIPSGDYRLRRLESAQRRLLTTAKMLATVRRLLAPAVQITLAHQQVNVAAGAPALTVSPPSLESSDTFPAGSAFVPTVVPAPLREGVTRRRDQIP